MYVIRETKTLHYDDNDDDNVLILKHIYVCVYVSHNWYKLLNNCTEIYSYNVINS